MKKIFYTSFFCISSLLSFAQFTPQAGLSGSDGIALNDPQIISWATNCTIERGWMDIADTSLGKVTHGDVTMAIGAPTISTNALSLGDGGSAILSFAHPIKNGAGNDFVVFENGFRSPIDSNLAFLELAFVEVSTDGINYVRFPSTYANPDTNQCETYATLDARHIDNLAGKHVWGYGTGFDLSQLANVNNLDINNINFVKLIDIIGDIRTNRNQDTQGNKINDPYPTPFAVGGFDITGVGVIHSDQPNNIRNIERLNVKLFPNPSKNLINIQLENFGKVTYQIFNPLGQKLQMGTLNNSNNTINIENLQKGAYYIELKSDQKSTVEKFIKVDN